MNRPTILYLARDADFTLHLFFKKPHKVFSAKLETTQYGFWEIKHRIFHSMKLDADLHPEINWEDTTPTRVTLRRINSNNIVGVING